MTGVLPAGAAEASNRFGRYAVPADALHRPAARRALRGEVFEADTIAYMRTHHRGLDIVHAGAFFGDFLPGVWSAMAPGATLWAFEPVPRNFECAEATVALNDLANVVLRRNALSDQAGTVTMQVTAADGVPLGGGSRIVLPAAADGATITAETVLLDDVVPAGREVGILQLDVEGHERQALCGAHRIITANLPSLIVEYMTDDAELSAIVGKPYRFVGMLHDNGLFEPVGRLPQQSY